MTEDIDPVARIVAAVLLIVVPLAFNAAFAALAAQFDYPDILRRPTAEILQKFRAGGSNLVLLWWGFALTAVLLTPLTIFLSVSLEGTSPAAVVAVAVTGVVASLVQFLGLIRWPFLVPYLARESESSSDNPARQEAIDVIFQSFNRYLGVAVGEHLGYLFTGAWSVAVGIAILQSSNVTWWIGILGVIIGIAFALCSLEFVGPFEVAGWRLAGAATPIVYIIWSLWLIVTGVALLL